VTNYTIETKQSEHTRTYKFTVRLTDWLGRRRANLDRTEQQLIEEGFHQSTPEEIARYHKFMLCDGEDPNSLGSIIKGWLRRVFRRSNIGLQRPPNEL
jgi:hypothetical protein